MTKIEVVITTVNYGKDDMETLRQVLAPAEVIHILSDNDVEIAAALERADVAILKSDLDERYLNAPKLRWIHCDHAGLNKSAKKEVFDKKLLVSSSAGRSAPALAEHALFFMLALAYNFPAFYKAQKSHQWGIPGQEHLRAIYGKTVGIIGMGNTGQELAVRVKACGMKVLGYRRTSTSLPAGVDQLYSSEKGDTLDELLIESDFVILALPLSDTTHHMIGAREFKLMKKTAFLVNMARGSVIDEKALLEALYAGSIAGAGLDTFEQEPLPADSPLWDAPNTLITPHVTPQVPDRSERSLAIICENVRRFRSGEPLLNLLKREDMYTQD